MNSYKKVRISEIIVGDIIRGTEKALFSSKGYEVLNIATRPNHQLVFDLKSVSTGQLTHNYVWYGPFLIVESSFYQYDPNQQGDTEDDI